MQTQLSLNIEVKRIVLSVTKIGSKSINRNFPIIAAWDWVIYPLFPKYYLKSASATSL